MQEKRELAVCDQEMDRIIQGSHHDPHTVLGLHDVKGANGKEIRVFRPGAKEVYLEKGGVAEPMIQVHPAGFFVLPVSKQTTGKDYKVYHQSGLLDFDPYTFVPQISDLDLYLFGQGTHYDLHQVLGARIHKVDGIAGVRFAVWAPSASRVSVVADHNGWHGQVAPMRSLGTSGVWELFIPGLTTGEHYKFEIVSGDGRLFTKTDPMALQYEKRPKTAAIVADLEQFCWTDADWMQKMEKEPLDRPVSIYEVHLGSWRRTLEGEFLSYRDLAHQLASYCQEMGFTHVELLPIAEHPFDQSWGYQVTGFYAPTSRFGSLIDFQYFVNHLHREGIGVILDWVPGHFPADSFALAEFDGSCLYEHADPRQGFHPHWNTLIFNLGRKEVSNFLLANALFWLKQLHIDGLRIDAVASMLYLDYGREKNAWIPNQYGGKENLESIEFFQHLHSIVAQQCPGQLMIAEESTSFSGITHPVEDQGIGFTMKWNMGWMNDTLRYFSQDPMYRCYHQNDLTFGLLYAFTERFCLVLSHDEVVHGKKSLLNKMPGDVWQKFAGLRLLFSYMFCQPGKKLLFMGGEIAQWCEWCESRSLDWHLLEHATHQGVQKMVKDLNHIYQKSPALYRQDFHWGGFEWVDFADHTNSVISYYRHGAGERLLCVHHFTPSCLTEYFVPLHHSSGVKEIFCSDACIYGGSGKGSPNPTLCFDETGAVCGMRLTIPPLATMIFEVYS